MTEQKEKRILLICTAGITSGLLVKNIQTAADEQNIPIRVYSAP
ncbi:MAG: PTS sugar transporter subunit IIB, partial [Streptococcus mitis]|nr:PTS sugar transporter subunit IIB [Streptococcus mitis]